MIKDSFFGKWFFLRFLVWFNTLPAGCSSKAFSVSIADIPKAKNVWIMNMIQKKIVKMLQTQTFSVRLATDPADGSQLT
jgi:hypothetical protein